MAITVGSGPNGVASPHSSGIKVVIVGLGLGGLSAAIECHRKGHTVIAFDKVRELKPIGDGVGIASNAARIVAKWGGGSVNRRLESLGSTLSTMEMYDRTGKFMVEDIPAGFKKGEGYLVQRGLLSTTFYKHAKSLGIDMRLGKKVMEYWEDEEKAGVIVDGERIEADCVIGTDGVNSIARNAITGQDPGQHSSGCAVFRAWIDAKELATDPESNWILKGTDNADQVKIFAGDGVHVLLSTVQQGKVVFWLCTHKDSSEAGDPWNDSPKIEEMLDHIKNWPCKSKIESIVRRTSQENLMHYPLLTRHPLNTWLSPGSRMILIGDAAHPYLPAAGQGAGQAIEDAATLAISLELAGKNNVKMALRIAEKIRYKRATAMQLGGLDLEKYWLNIDWDAAEMDPTILKIPRPNWVYGHDCQRYAYEEFEKVTQAIEQGREYVAQNVPTGGKYFHGSAFEGLEKKIGDFR